MGLNTSAIRKCYSSDIGDKVEANSPADPEFNGISQAEGLEYHADGVIQLRFRDYDSTLTDINAHQLAEVLDGLVEFTSDMSKDGVLGEGPPPEVRVRPIKEGSVIVEAVMAYTATNPFEALTFAGSAGAAAVKAIDVGLKKLRGTRVSDFDYLDNGNMKISWDDGTADEVPTKAWNRLNKMSRRTRGSLRKIMSPLGGEADLLEVRDGTADQSTGDILATEPDVEAGLSEYREATREVDDVDEVDREFETEAQFSSVDFRPGEKWRIRTLEGSRQVTIEDEDFLRKLDGELSIHKNDIFWVTIREHATRKNGRTTYTWAVTKVDRRRRGSDDDSDESPE